ncbi:MAG: tetratricopeptide repeat protein, partial [Myxococcota bacterium]
MGRLTSAMRAFGLIAGLAFAPACSNTLAQAQLAYDNGEYEEAETLYKQTMEEGDEVDTEIAREELFDLHMEQAKEAKGKAKRQEEHYRKALTLQPGDGEAREGLAHALVALYRHDEALQIVQDGVDSNTCKGCQRMLAVVLIERADAEGGGGAGGGGGGGG